MGKRGRVVEAAAKKTKTIQEVVDGQEESTEHNDGLSTSEEEEETVALPEGSRLSDEPPIKRVSNPEVSKVEDGVTKGQFMHQGKWINKTRVLIFAARGIGHRDRHLMQNLRDMLPHSKSECKIEAKNFAKEIDEICIMKNANKCVFFENKKRKDTYCWLSNVGRGPSAKFLVENIHTMEELKMTGNSLKASRALLSFDPLFDQSSHYSLLKEMLTQTFSTPNHHPRSQPFIDHVLTFTILDHRIWFRNYQIVDEEGALAEIGPRFVLNPIKIFEGSFTGCVLWSNENYVSPNDRRRAMMIELRDKYKNRVMDKEARIARQPKGAAYTDLDHNQEVFETIAPEEANEAFKKVFKRTK